MVSYLKDFYEFVTTDVAIISSQKSVKVLIIYCPDFPETNCYSGYIHLVFKVFKLVIYRELGYITLTSNRFRIIRYGFSYEILSYFHQSL